MTNPRLWSWQTSSVCVAHPLAFYYSWFIENSFPLVIFNYYHFYVKRQERNIELLCIIWFAKKCTHLPTYEPPFFIEDITTLPNEVPLGWKICMLFQLPSFPFQLRWEVMYFLGNSYEWFFSKCTKALSKRLKIKFLDVGKFGQGGAGERLLMAILHHFKSCCNATLLWNWKSTSIFL